MKTYIGWRDSDGKTVISINEDERREFRLLPNQSQKIFNLSPDGFEWGYGGSGPAQLALALLLDATGDKQETKEFYQRFKVARVMGFPHEGWRITQDEIITWLQNEQVRELMS